MRKRIWMVLAFVTASIVLAQQNAIAAEEAAEREGLAEDAGKESGSSNLGEIVVTGSHIRGAQPVGNQLLTFDREALQATGIPSVAEILRTLPQNFGGGPSEDTRVGIEASQNTARSTTINLRGLGATATLVLINGRRVAPAGTQGAFVDLSSIPLSAVERIDVLPDGASAIYGSDAVGGVVNVVLRRDFEGAETSARYGGATEGDARTVVLGQTLGGEWSTGQALLNYEHYRRDAVPASARTQSASSDLRPLGGANFGNTFNNPGTIFIGAQRYAIPAGQDGTSLTPADFTAGTTNFGNLNEGLDLFAEHERGTVFVTGSQQLGPSVSVFADALAGRRSTFFRQPGTLQNLVVPVSNAFYVHPTGGTGPVRVAYNFYDDLGPRTADLRVDSYHTALGLQIDVSPRWRVIAQGGYALEKVDQIQHGAIRQQALALALADPNPATAFNPFGDGSFTNADTLASLAASTQYLSDSYVASANVTADGTVWTLPGGDLRLAIGADYRKQVFSAVTVPVAPAAPLVSDYSRNVTAAYAEAVVPLFGSDNARAGLKGLELSVAARREKYSDFGESTNPRVGLAWTPVDALRLRGTWSTSFKAPGLGDLDEALNFSTIQFAPDPLQPNSAPSAVLVWLGKNRDLQEETATSWTAGFDFSVPWLHGLTLGLTYFAIEYQDRIQDAPFTFTWLTDPQFAGLVVRDPTTAQRDDVCTRSQFGGLPQDCRNAPIAAIVDLRANNTAVVENRGVDLLATWDTSVGAHQLSFGLNASYLIDFRQAQVASAPRVELVSTHSNPIDLRLRGSLGWRRGGFAAAAFINHADSYRDTVSEPDRRIGSWSTLDINLSYATGAARSSFFADTLISLAVQNVFDEDPPFFNNPTGVGYDRENVDLLGRFASLQVSKRW